MHSVMRTKGAGDATPWRRAFAVRLLGMAGFAAVAFSVSGCVSAIEPVLGSVQASSSTTAPVETPLLVVAPATTEGTLAASAAQAGPETWPASEPVFSLAAIPVPAPRNALAQSDTDAALAFAPPAQTPQAGDPVQLASLTPQSGSDAQTSVAAASGQVWQEQPPAAKPVKQPGSLYEFLQMRKAQREALAGHKPAIQPATAQQAKIPAADQPQTQLAALAPQANEARLPGGVVNADDAMTGDPVALPGVATGDTLFGISHDEGEDEEANNSYQVAALGSLGRLSPNGIRTQTDKVQVGCFDGGLVDLLRSVEGHYGRPVVVTSGFRDLRSNRKAGGARQSMHVLCKAADIQIEGVSKWDLAKYLRTVSGRGGVGTYCRTDSVHIDIGPERDWHHPCRRTKKKTRRA